MDHQGHEWIIRGHDLHGLGIRRVRALEEAQLPVAECHAAMRDGLFPVFLERLGVLEELRGRRRGTLGEALSQFTPESLVIRLAREVCSVRALQLRRQPSNDQRVCGRRKGSSGLIRAHQGSSGLIKAHQGSSRVIKGHQGSSGVIRGNQLKGDGRAAVIRGTPRPFETLALVAIRGY